MHINELYQIFLKYSTVSTDTRNIKSNSLFFALKGERFNANEFAADALKAGAQYAIIDDANYQVNNHCILVTDVLKTLQELAAYHRKQLQIPVIAIVGSNGKTTTKELLTAVLSQKWNVLATPGNFNNHIGLPLTMLQINANHNIAIIEMGANHIGENAFLCEIAQPSMGIVTNNGKDHLEGFGSIEGVAESNAELYTYLHTHKGLAFINAHDAWLMSMAKDVTNKKTYAANFTERQLAADYTCFAQALRPQIQFSLPASEHIITSPLSGDYNFDNIMVAVAFAQHLGLTETQIKKGVESYQPANNRSQVLKTNTNTIYMDAYNANPSSMELAIRNFAAMPFENKVLFLGDMFELGKYEAEEHQAIVNLCKQLQLQEVYLCGKAFSQTQSPYTLFENTEACLSYLKENTLSDKNIFMKGSRGMKLETLVPVL